MADGEQKNSHAERYAEFAQQLYKLTELARSLPEDDDPEKFILQTFVFNVKLKLHGLENDNKFVLDGAKHIMIETMYALKPVFDKHKAGMDMAKQLHSLSS